MFLNPFLKPFSWLDLSRQKTWLQRNYNWTIPPVLYCLLWWTPIVDKFGFIPDYLQLINVDPREYFGLIIGAISSILGILMAVVLLYVEFSNERLVQNKLLNPIDNTLTRNALLASINLIVLSFVSYSHISSFTESTDLTLGYLIGVFFISYIILVFPTVKSIVSKSSNLKQNLEIIETLKIDSFRDISTYHGGYFNDDNKLKNLRMEIDNYILSNNINEYTRLHNELLDKALSIINNNPIRSNCSTVFAALRLIWFENSKTAIRVNDFYFFELIWSLTKKIFHYFAINKLPLLNLNEIAYFLEMDFFELHEKLNDPIPLTTSMDAIEFAFFQNLINNCPDESKIWKIQMYYDGEVDEMTTELREASIQWDKISEIVFLMNKVQEAAINIKARTLFEDCTRRINSIVQRLTEPSIQIGDRARSFLIQRIFSSSFYYSDMAVEKGLFETTYPSFDVPNYLLQNIIRSNEIIEKDLGAILSSLSDYVIINYKRSTLDVSVGVGTLNEYCMIPNLIIEQYKSNKLAKKAVDYIISVIEHLKKYTEENNLIDKHAQGYMLLKIHIKNYSRIAVENTGFNPKKKPVKKWRKILKKFKKVTQERSFAIVKWGEK
ncbi:MULTISPECIES: hypothetical protein [unclassified Allomuricauda]|nr:MULTISPECIES: hypothetical protein [unclassified Allomuricauda]